jgi:hypothetical protein
MRVRVPLRTPLYGLVAHLIERFNGIEEVEGLIPFRSTTLGVM